MVLKLLLFIFGEKLFQVNDHSILMILYQNDLH